MLPVHIVKYCMYIAQCTVVCFIVKEMVNGFFAVVLFKKYPIIFCIFITYVQMYFIGDLFANPPCYCSAKSLPKVMGRDLNPGPT